MEIEFDVKITSNILYDYMLRHTYSSLSGLTGSLVGVLMLMLFASNRQPICLIIGAVILLYLPWTLFIKSKQQALNTPAFKKPLHYRLSDEGIEVSQDGTTEKMGWETCTGQFPPHTASWCIRRAQAPAFFRKKIWGRTGTK